jgi:D-alanyl-D-alanine carboxypeptidase
MASRNAPAASDPPILLPSTSSQPATRRRGRRRRLATILATVSGLSLIGAGLIATAGGLAGRSGVAGGSGAIPEAPQASGTPGSSDGSSGAVASARPTPAPPSGPSRAVLLAQALQARLQASLDGMRVGYGIPGVSATIIFDDGTSWTGVSGLADVEAGIPVTPATGFALASITKTFTAALVLELVSQGELSLGASVGSYLPGVEIDGRVTVGQLLDHTSGLADFFLNPRIDAALQGDPGLGWSIARTLRFVGKPLFAPGSAWRYSNTNYLLAGLVVERLTGLSLAQAMRDRLFDPLGLEDTWYQVAEPAPGPVAHGYRFAGTKRSAPPIDLSDGTNAAPFTSVVTAAAGAGAVGSTSADAARWARLLFGGDVLGPAGTGLMLEGFAGTAAYRPSVPYGYGVQAVVIDGRPTLGHSGRFLGFRAAVRHLPLEGVTIAVLTNQSRTDPGLIVRNLLDLLFPIQPPCRTCARPV